MLMLLLTGCTGETIIKVVCPPLSPPPDAAIDALAAAAKTNATVGAWIVDLDRHYQKLDACK